MKKVLSHIKKNKGFSLIEILLAGAIFLILVTGLVGAYLYGQEASMLSGNRTRATLLAQEGLEVVQNIRDSNWLNITDGIYGLTTSSNQWNFTTSSDTNDIFTRQISISTIDTNRKLVTSTVTWQQNLQRSGSISLSTRLTRWFATIGGVGDWTNPNVEINSIDLSTNDDGLKIQISGNYAYLIRNAKPSFYIIDISNPASTTLVSSYALPLSPTNLFVLGNYVYISSSDNASELEIIDISNPLLPNMIGTFNASGNANANGIYVSRFIYLTRQNNGAAGDFLIFDRTVPSAPSLLSSLNTGGSSFEVSVSGTVAFVASSDNTAELKVINISNIASPTIIGSYNAPGGIDGTAINSFGSTVLLSQGPILYLINVSVPSSPSLLSSYNAGETINEISLGNNNTYAFLATASSTSELQVVDISNSASPTFIGGFNGTNTFNGIAYDQNSDRAYIATSIDTKEFSVIAP